jgi:hypothetical protein
MHSYDPPYVHNDVKPSNVLITHCKRTSTCCNFDGFYKCKAFKKRDPFTLRSITVAGLSMLASEFFIVPKDAYVHILKL